jgi:ubiquinone biosynthesis protein
MSQVDPSRRGEEILVLSREGFSNNLAPLRLVSNNSSYHPTWTDSFDSSYSRRTRTGRTLEQALKSKKVKVNRVWVFIRLLRIAVRFTYFYLGTFRYRLQGLTEDERDKRNAPRFSELLESLGGVFIKVGQQLSQRPDILPIAYCEQLRDFLHDVGEKIPLPAVEAAIKRRTGKSIAENFSYFDPEPIGKASVSCVYRACLETGEEVAVKVRRPGLEKTFTADITALNWIMHLVEFLTIWRPGMTGNLRIELERLLLEELDFLIEARYQEIFRRYLKRRKKLKVTAPKVYYRFSSPELMVSEFISAYSMADIIKALDENDEGFLANLSRDKIDPKRLAKQLVRSRYYSFHECPLFHGDPHPANILVQPDNHIVMIDFGACGVFTERDRNGMWNLNRYYAKENVAGMVNMVIGIMEPVEPVRGLYQFRKDLIDAWWQGFYGIKSKHAEGWERSSVFLWLKYFQLVRKHQIPIGRNVVRMIRATLLYDTVAAKLYPQVNVFKEFQKYRDDVARRTHRRIVRSAVRQLIQGPDDQNFMKLQQVADVSDGLLNWAQRLLEDPQFSFAAVAGKVYAAIRSLARFLLLVGTLAIVGGAAIVTYIYFAYRDNPLSQFIRSVIETVTEKPGNRIMMAIAMFWFLTAAGFLLAYGRRVYLRFGDLDD